MIWSLNLILLLNSKNRGPWIIEHVFFRFNNIFTLLNLSVVIFVIAAGSSKASFDNWRIGESSAALKGTVGETEEETDVDENINIGMTCALYEKPVLQISRFC